MNSTNGNLQTLRDLALKANTNERPNTAAEAVYLAAIVALKETDEDEIEEIDFNDVDSCGVNRYYDSNTGETWWQAFVDGDQGDDVTRCTLADALTAEKWYDVEWTFEL